MVGAERAGLKVYVCVCGGGNRESVYGWPKAGKAKEQEEGEESGAGRKFSLLRVRGIQRHYFFFLFFFSTPSPTSHPPKTLPRRTSPTTFTPPPLPESALQQRANRNRHTLV